MKKLTDYKDEINKCSKCGLCQSVCPVYKETGNDCAVSRGKFIMLDGVLKGDLELNQNIEKYLDLCLKCNKCKDFCPSNIDVCNIFACAKAECLKKSPNHKLISFLQSKFMFNNILKLGKIFFAPFTKQININAKTNKNSLKLLYFKGCVNEVFSKVENATKKVLSDFNVEIIEKDFECCGLPFLSSGNAERFLEVAKHNTDLISKEKFDYLITDCASCASTISNYANIDEATKNLNIKPINIVEFIANQNVEFIFKKPIKVTFHKPCHLENDDFLKPIFAKCKNVEYIEMEDYDACCGFAGEFAIKNNKISRSISQKKAQNAISTNADYILTTCPACVMGLTQGLICNKNFFQKQVKVLNLIEFLAKSDEIKLF